jgi:hypothetical protein
MRNRAADYKKTGGRHKTQAFLRLVMVSGYEETGGPHDALVVLRMQIPAPMPAFRAASCHNSPYPVGLSVTVIESPAHARRW